ncbi:MAG: UDP-N-acetylmuramoyl-L-alanine--D-glutamate ligase [Bacteroidia bacterium]|nr:UDP-N-acetylmuramoyl-L-alanine--D-glutamate ligase [Bacteroidia bacterium]
MGTRNKIVVLGAGESGVGAAVLAQKKGFDVFVSDKGVIKQNYADILTAHEIAFEQSQHSWDKMHNATEVIKSPGIPNTAQIIKQFKEQSTPIISEIEFAARYTQAKKICITGTNGKTTTTMLTYHILSKAGLKVGLAGNVGKSFAMQVALDAFDFYVIELSSFQLDDMHQFKAEIAILLNITPDHLDRYEYSMQRYIDSKMRIIQNQTNADAFIFNDDDALIKEAVLKHNPKSNWYPFSITHSTGMAAYANNDQLIINIKSQFTMSIFELAIQGKHNLYNSMAAGIASRLVDIRKEDVRDSMQDFASVEHRLEFVNTISGVDFINDSKATNINSAWYALESMKRPVIWIAGGQDKGNDYEQLHDVVKEKVKAIVCLGVDNKKIVDEFKSIIPDIFECNTADDAVKVAYKLARKGDIVLLSPACASFDLFKNYEDRGRQFKAAVKSL